MSNKIKSALSKEAADEASNITTEVKKFELEKSNISKIATTIDAIIKSILRKVVDSNRIDYRDTESYLGILLDDNNRKWICRNQEAAQKMDDYFSKLISQK